MKTTEEIIKSHAARLARVDYKKKPMNDSMSSPDLYLFMKWAYRVGKGWYGFALSSDVPFVWAQIIDEFLDELAKEAPNFEIHQIKLKFGGLRFYVDLRLKDKKKVETINAEIVKLCTFLFNEGLIY